MKSKTFLKLAVGTVLAGASLSAFAINSATVPAGNRLFVGGATATDNVLRDVFLSSTVGICQPGTIDVYEGSNQLMIACTSRALAGFPNASSRAVLYVKESNGGSGNGVQPVANQSNLTFLNPDAPNCTGAVTNNFAYGAGLSTVTRRQGCTGTTSRAPGAGISDVEPALLGASPAQQAQLTSSGLTDIIFGVPVTTALRDQLQAAQGLTVGSDTCENTPSLTSAQVRGMYTGFIGDLAQLVEADAGDAGPSLNPGPIRVCRRGDSSGTQASAEAFWLHQRCEGGVLTFVTPDEQGLCQAGGCAWPTQGAADFRDDFFYAGSGSGQVRSCLDFHGDAGNFAIGVLSTESDPFALGQSWRYIRVDGALSTREQTANGNWQFFSSNVLNRRNPSVLNSTQNELAQYFVSNVGNPTFVTGINSPFQNNVCTNGGDGGVLAVAGTPFPAGVEAPFDAAEMDIAPINTMTRQPQGAINNCQPAIPLDTEAAGGQFRNNVAEF